MKKRLLVLLAMLALLCAGSAMAETVEYVNRVWENNAVTKTNETAENCTAVTASDTAWGTAGSKSWYVVSSDVTNSGRITVNGDVHLILMDGKTLTASQGVAVTAGNSLTIYGQTNDTGTMTATGSGGNAGIGGGYGSNGGTITIRGGKITAQGGNGSAGIGGGRLYYNSNVAQGTVTIEGGTVNATGGSHGAGIGSGEGGNATVTISGGTILEATASGYGGAGIGSGYNGGATVIIQGGTIMKAEGGTNGAAIGGHNGSATVIIQGGSVNADPQKVDSPRDGMSNEVFLHTLTLDGAADGTPIESAKGTVGYGVKDVRTIGDKLYFWLTKDSGISEMSAGGVRYWNQGNGWFTMEKPDGGMPQEAQKLPQTGDPSMLMGWMALLAASGAMGMKMRRKK